jgi:hypothetical protein
MNVFEPFRTHSSPSRRANVFIEPNASEPEPGSVIAHAPIFSMVRSGYAQRSFCRSVPFDMMAPPASPTVAPIAITKPGLTRDSSIATIDPYDGSRAGSSSAPASGASTAPSAGSSVFATAPSPLPLPPAARRARSRSTIFLNDDLTIWLSPNVSRSLRISAYGSIRSDSRSSSAGVSSFSAHCRIIFAIIWCCSVNSNMLAAPCYARPRICFASSTDAGARPTSFAIAAALPTRSPFDFAISPDGR